MYIIAEIGINHNGDINLAKDMISQAKACGADAVKLQKRDINTVYTPEFLDSPRETPPGVLKKLPNGGTTQREQKAALEFSWDEYDEIDRHCKAVDIEWFGSAWDVESLFFLESYHPPFHKIASPMITSHNFVAEVAKMKRAIIMSTGMSTGKQITDALSVIRNNGWFDIILMHCVSIYPCPPKLTNLMEIQALSDYGYQVGYSGHESGTTPTLVAMALGARYIERHFTIDRSMYGSDQSASLEPAGLRRICECARVIEDCLLTPAARPHPQEMENAKKLRYWEE